jgi:hypothetical protein
MASGDQHGLIVNGKRTVYTEYKLQPGDRGKTLKQIAREQLYDENLFTLILKKRDDPTKQPIWEEIVTKDNLDPNWTLLLPPSEYATFTLRDKANVRRTPKLESGNIHFEGQVGVAFVYKKSSATKDANGMLWVDISKSNTIPNKDANATYWVCVKEGNIHHTAPQING